MTTKNLNKTNKTFVLEVLKYGLRANQYELISTKDVVIKYNGGENWNSAYVDDWYDLYVPVKLHKHKVVNKGDMIKGSPPCTITLHHFNNLLSDLKKALDTHFKVYATQLSIGNNMLYLEFCVDPR
jgi:hypothetical protein